MALTPGLAFFLFDDPHANGDVHATCGSLFVENICLLLLVVRINDGSLS